MKHFKMLIILQMQEEEEPKLEEGIAGEDQVKVFKEGGILLFTCGFNQI